MSNYADRLCELIGQYIAVEVDGDDGGATICKLIVVGDDYIEVQSFGEGAEPDGQWIFFLPKIKSICVENSDISRLQAMNCMNIEG